MTEPKLVFIPKCGRIVHYTLAAHDLVTIRDRRKASLGLLDGNPVAEGQVFPMIITEDWKAESIHQAVNGQVMLDGNDTLWVSSRIAGEGPGTWTWPVRG